MHHDFWHERWTNNQIGFHQAEVNPHLRQSWPSLGVAPGQRVFVPLCGKSRDLLWLREQGFDVVGVELSPLAVKAFFEENGLNSTVQQEGPFTAYRTTGICIYCGDFFALTQDHLDGVAAVFDRASLVALPPDMRASYARHMLHLLPRKVPILLVAFDYPQQEMTGPPFSVAEAEVRTLFGKDREICLLHRLDILAQEPRFREKGVSRMEELIFVLK